MQLHQTVFWVGLAVYVAWRVVKKLRETKTQTEESLGEKS